MLSHPGHLSPKWRLYGVGVLSRGLECGQLLRPGSSAGVEQLSGVVEPTPKAPRTYIVCTLALKYPM